MVSPRGLLSRRRPAQRASERAQGGRTGGSEAATAGARTGSERQRAAARGGRPGVGGRRAPGGDAAPRLRRARARIRVIAVLMRRSPRVRPVSRAPRARRLPPRAPA
ncbi:MAG: hypothetical protein ACK559_09465, partial [bacterium]